MKILGRNFPIFNKAVKWVCRASQVIGDDGKSIEDKLEEIGTNGGGSESGSGSGNNLLTLTLYGNGNYVPGEHYLRFIIEDENDSGYTPKKTDTKSSGDSSTVKKSEVDAIVNAGAYCQFVLLYSTIPAIIEGVLVLNGSYSAGTFYGIGNTFNAEKITLTIDLNNNVVDILYTSLISNE